MLVIRVGDLTRFFTCMLFGLVLLYLIHALGLSQTVCMMSERCKLHRLQDWRAPEVKWQSIQCLVHVSTKLHECVYSRFGVVYCLYPICHRTCSLRTRDCSYVQQLDMCIYQLQIQQWQQEPAWHGRERRVLPRQLACARRPSSQRRPQLLQQIHVTSLACLT